MFKGIARFFVATAAGAGLGAGAALAKRHLAARHGPGGSQEEVWTPPASASEPAAPAPPPQPEQAAPPPQSEPPGPVPSEPGRAGDLADLEAARSRLRERAAALRKEMEKQVGS